MTRQILLMGDIVGSSEYPGGAEALMRQFQKIVASVNSGLSDDLLSPLTITLGDEFQGIPASPAAAARCILLLEEIRIAREAHFRTRYVIHEGEVETPINPARAHGMLGPGLTEARELLEASKGQTRLARVTVSLRDDDRADFLHDALRLALYFIDRWDEDDYPYVRRFLEGLDYKEVADALQRDPSTAWRRERSLDMLEYRTARRIVERAAR